MRQNSPKHCCYDGQTPADAGSRFIILWKVNFSDLSSIQTRSLNPLHCICVFVDQWTETFSMETLPAMGCVMPPDRRALDRLEMFT